MSVDTTTLGPNSNIRNTINNRNTIAPVLYSICVNNNAPITLTGGDSHDLNSTDVYQAVCVPGGQAIDASNATGSSDIVVGPDTSAKALEWMQHLNILEPTRTVLLKFYSSEADTAAAVNLSNGDSTHDHVEIRLENGSGNTSRQLLGSGSCAGLSVLVEVSCTSNTAGSEKVVFNILRGYNICD